MPELFDYLNEINLGKRDLLRASPDLQYADRKYPKFMILRMLSYHPDAILIVNELNINSTSSHNMSGLQTNDVLLNTITKRKRFTKYKKPQKTDLIDTIKSIYNVNDSIACEYLELMSDSEISNLVKQSEQRNDK